MGSYLLDSGEQFINLIFWISLEKKMLLANMENTLNGKISPKSVYISVNNNTKLKFFLILSIWDGLSLKTISRYCPFNHNNNEHHHQTVSLQITVMEI
jgi:hypothetical protein